MPAILEINTNAFNNIAISLYQSALEFGIMNDMPKSYQAEAIANAITNSTNYMDPDMGFNSYTIRINNPICLDDFGNIATIYFSDVAKLEHWLNNVEFNLTKTGRKFHAGLNSNAHDALLKLRNFCNTVQE